MTPTARRKLESIQTDPVFLHEYTPTAGDLSELGVRGVFLCVEVANSHSQAVSHKERAHYLGRAIDSMCVASRDEPFAKKPEAHSPAAVAKAVLSASRQADNFIARSMGLQYTVADPEKLRSDVIIGEVAPVRGTLRKQFTGEGSKNERARFRRLLGRQKETGRDEISKTRGSHSKTQE